jgi:hypothetical protein
MFSCFFCVSNQNRLRFLRTDLKLAEPSVELSAVAVWPESRIELLVLEMFSNMVLVCDSREELKNVHKMKWHNKKRQRKIKEKT